MASTTTPVNHREYAPCSLSSIRDVRSTAQAQALKQHLPVDMVMNLDVPKQVIVDRLTDRWIHPGSGRVYAYAYRPPKVRHCGD